MTTKQTLEPGDVVTVKSWDEIKNTEYSMIAKPIYYNAFGGCTVKILEKRDSELFRGKIVKRPPGHTRYDIINLTVDPRGVKHIGKNISFDY